MWQNFVLVSGSIKSIAKGIHETFLFSGKIIFYCIVSIAICTEKVSCIFSQPLYQQAQILPLIHTLFVIRDTFGPHTYLHGPFPRPSSSWAHRISLLPPLLLGQVSWHGQGTKGNAFSGLEVLVLQLEMLEEVFLDNVVIVPPEAGFVIRPDQPGLLADRADQSHAVVP